MIKPLSNHLVVERIPQQKLGMIHVPAAFDDDNNTGGPKHVRIIAVGPGRRNKKGVLIPIEAQPGDRAIIHSNTAGPQPVGNNQFVITAEQIVAVIPQ